jgi:hypothetical protein
LWDDLYNSKLAVNMFNWVSTPSPWTDPLALSGTWTGGNVRPRMATGEDGTLHVVWLDLTTGENRIYYRTRSSLGEWSNVTDVDGAASACNPEVAVAGDGTVHISWQDKRSGGWEVYYRSLSPGGVWTPALDEDPVLLSDGLGGSAGPTLAAAGDGTLHAAWSDNNVPCVWYRTRSVDGTWSDLIEVAASDGGSKYPQVAVGPDGTMHMIYYRQAGETIYRSRSADGTWTPVLDFAGVNVSNNAGDSHNSPWFGIEAGDDGTVHTVWHDDTDGDSEIWYRSLSTEGIWEPALDMDPVNVSDNTGGSYYPDIALGDGG